MNIHDEIYLNKIAQDLIPMTESIHWFANKSDEEKIGILKVLYYYIVQGRGNGLDVDEAIELSQLKKTYTPCCLLLKSKEIDKNRTSVLKIYLEKIIKLPKNEWVKSFILLSYLFNVVSKKQNVTDWDRNTKWWKNDLSNNDFIKEIINKYNEKVDGD